MEDSGRFSSPGFPHKRYPNQIKCVWRISTDPNRRIALGIVDKNFDLEPGSNIHSCDYDAVNVFNGVSRNGRKTIGSFCGNTDFLQTFSTVYSANEHLYVEFTSDHIVQRRGFQLQYSVFFKGTIIHKPPLHH